MFKIKQTTNLCYLLRDDEVLLIYKKRGLGQGKWNGPGGKVENGESPEGAAKREVAEETGYQPLKLESIGYLEFIWEAGEEHNNQRTYIYTCHEFSGDLHESEECLPKWWKIRDIPLDQMWDDDKHWLLEALKTGQVQKRFYFDKNNQVKHWENISD